MSLRKREGVVLNCFSPPVMVATLVIEFGLAAYVIWRYKLNVLTRLIVTLLVCLGVFQLAEYFVCTGSVGYAEQWSRLGFVAITALPPLGLHVMHRLASKPNRRLIITAYATMAAFMAFFLAYQGAFVGNQCTGNYVIFQLAEKAGGLYSLYYYGWLLTGITLGIKWVGELNKKAAANRQKLETVKALVLAYLVFLVPTAVANTISPETRRGIPSVMCGFAVLMALILALYILPKVGQARKKPPTA